VLVRNRYRWLRGGAAITCQRQAPRISGCPPLGPARPGRTPRQDRPALVIVPGDGRAACSSQEIKVSALTGLLHVFDVEPRVAAAERRHLR